MSLRIAPTARERGLHPAHRGEDVYGHGHHLCRVLWSRDHTGKIGCIGEDVDRHGHHLFVGGSVVFDERGTPVQRVWQMLEGMLADFYAI